MSAGRVISRAPFSNYRLKIIGRPIIEGLRQSWGGKVPLRVRRRFLRFHARLCLDEESDLARWPERRYEFLRAGACAARHVLRAMKCRFANLTPKQTWLQPARLAIVSFAALIATGGVAGAAGGRNERSVTSIESREPGEPIMAIVSLRSQQITVYDANGWILRAPVSSGQKGRETPAGIYAVIEKQAEHYSNLYDDAYMPHMQRITWSGIALHGGQLPGYPASHGCIRMPYGFAERLFEATRLGMRVIVVPGKVAPVAITDPALFPPKPGAGVVAAARAAKAAEAANKADQARTRRRDGLPRSSAGNAARAHRGKSETQS
jgi:L,D-transpeptidase catalytic domain